MTDLVEFLRARLDEDDQMAREAGKRATDWRSDGVGGGGEPITWDDEGGWIGEHTIVYSEGWPEGGEALHIARHDPARVLREVAAKRRILDLAGEISRSGAEFAEQDYRTLTRSLAAVYSDHPDYQQEWAIG
ncbi:hypothetical protein GS443_02760 [Rhodococcus hoagii]|nr:hypothetical protein [Prescottella equi]